MGGPTVSAVIATRHRGDRIVALIESVLAADHADFELVVVDQSLDDATQTAIEPFTTDPRVRYERSDTVGTSRARNLGFAMTSGEIVLVTDDDCTVPSNWFSGMLEPFEQDPRVGIVFCTVRAVPDDRPGHTPAIEQPGNQTIDDVSDAWRLGRSGLNLGAGMAIRRSAFDDIDGFDELTGPGARFGACEDNDLSWRVLLAGWTMFLSSDVIVMHDGWRDLDEFRELVTRDLFGVGGAAAKYLRTGQYGITGLLVSWLVRFGITGPGRQLMNGRKPSGLRRPIIIVRGLIAGWRTPMDHDRRMYLPNSQR